MKFELAMGWASPRQEGSMPVAQLKANYSVILEGVGADLPDEVSVRYLAEETRWHYSQHLLAECRGEEVIEDLLARATEKKQRAILSAQLRDEQRHAKLLTKITDQLGLDERANGYAKGYSSLVKEQMSLAEKIYVFQIITEAASAAYCAWRLNAMADPVFFEIDSVIFADETRHLKMGESMLSICDRDDLAISLSASRRAALLRAMNSICRRSGDEMSETIVGHKFASKTKLDRLISRSVLKEAREVERLLTAESPHDSTSS